MRIVVSSYQILGFYPQCVFYTLVLLGPDNSVWGADLGIIGF